MDYHYFDHRIHTHPLHPWDWGKALKNTLPSMTNLYLLKAEIIPLTQTTVIDTVQCIITNDY